MPKADFKKGPVPSKKRAVVGILLLLARFEHQSAEDGRHRNRQQPAEHHGNAYDLEKAAAELACGVRRQADRSEGKHGDGRPPQHGPLGAFHGLGSGVGQVHAALDAHKHPFGHHDGVVHQGTEGDNQGRQGHDLQIDARILHNREGPRHGQQKDTANHQPRPHAHEDQKHADHDGQRLQQVDDKVADRLDDHVRLHVDLVKLHAHGAVDFQLPQALFDGLAHGDHVAARDCGDADAKGLPSLVVHQERRRRDLVAAHVRYFLQADQASAGTTDHQLADVLNGHDGPSGRNPHEAAVQQGAADGGQGVLLIEDRENRVSREPQGGQLIGLELNVDGFLLVTDDLHARHARHQDDLLFQEISVVPELPHGVAVAHKGVVLAVDVAEVVVDHGRGPRGILTCTS